MPVTAREWFDASINVSSETTEQRILKAVLAAPTWESPIEVDMDETSRQELTEGFRCR